MRAFPTPAEISAHVTSASEGAVTDKDLKL